ncbi:MAG: RdgB/HAM1 family non-canonical purine NTP pyrophosphatase [Chitinophagales bacterium]
MKLLFATHNANKVREIKSLLPGGIELVSLADLHFYDDIPETELTLEGNARLKAQFLFQRLGLPCFAEDTGLEIDALHGAPGVFSARYAGEPSDPARNMAKVLHEMAGVAQRTARFRTVIAHFSGPDVVYYTGVCEGTILEAPRGNQGFGYDPIFQPAGCNLSFGEMRLEDKNQFSHRKKAFDLFLANLRKA